MLKFLRTRGIQKKIFIGLTVAVVLSFVVSGLLVSQDGGKATSALAQFEKHSISVQEYLASYKAVQRQAGMMYGDKLNELRSQINFKGEAWDRLLVLEYAKKQGIRAGDKDVVKWITKQEGFWKDGKFDDSLYKMYVERALRTTPRQFEEEIRQMLTLAKVQDKIRQELDLPDAELKQQYMEENAERDLVYGLVPLGSPQKEAEKPLDTEIDKLAQSLEGKLTDEKTGAILTPEEIKTELDQKAHQTKALPVAVEKLTSAKAKILDPDDFETVLKAEGVTVEKLDKYKKGTYPAGIWPSENLQKAVEKLKPGEVSEVFDVPKGAMIVKVTAAREADEKKFEEEKGSYKDRVADGKSREKFEEILKEMREKLSLNLELMKELFPADAS